jgi:hypothetical protein
VALQGVQRQLHIVRIVFNQEDLDGMLARNDFGLRFHGSHRTRSCHFAAYCGVAPLEA